jgi:hypothetical protein
MFVSGKLHDRDVMIEGARVIDRAARAQQQLIVDLLDVLRMATGHLRLVLQDLIEDDTMTRDATALLPDCVTAIDSDGTQCRRGSPSTGHETARPARASSI